MTRRKSIGIRALKHSASRIVGEVRERGSEYVVTKHGKAVAVLRPWSDEEEESHRLEVAKTLATMEASAARVAEVAGRRSARTAVDRQRR